MRHEVNQVLTQEGFVRVYATNDIFFSFQLIQSHTFSSFFYLWQLQMNSNKHAQSARPKINPAPQEGPTKTNPYFAHN